MKEGEKETGILETINSPADLKELDPQALEQLAAEIRQKIVETVSETGGHLA
ncbi:MAG: 1-deoxy-D-xylulose-5-phosphate synthase N-terminal domain-containing protein, partial [Desulfobacteraceae bacterium]